MSFSIVRRRRGRRAGARGGHSDKFSLVGSPRTTVGTDAGQKDLHFDVAAWERRSWTRARDLVARCMEREIEAVVREFRYRCRGSRGVVVALGLGPVSESRSALLQLAFAHLVCQRAEPPAALVVHDPVMRKVRVGPPRSAETTSPCGVCSRTRRWWARWVL